MMKKVLYGVALALFASVSVGSLQSCKDDVNDLRTQTSYDLNALQGKIKAEMDALEARVAANEGAIAQIKRDYATLAYVDGEIARVEAGYAAADAALEQRINGALSTLTQRIDGLDVEVAKKADKDYVDGELGALKDQLAALEEVAATKDEVEEVWLQLEQIGEWLTQLRNELKDDIDGLQGQIDTINTNIDSIITALDNVTNRLDKQVSGILIQGVNSPVFGDLSLPIGIRSNILFNWYGNNISDEFEFPQATGEHSATGTTGLVLPIAAADKFKVPAGNYGGYENEADKVSLGTVYVTINPVGALLKNLSEVTLETSAGNALPWPVKLVPSDKELTFGVTRSAENGFYEAEIVASVEDVMDNVNIEIEEGLKTSMKNALKDPSMTTAKDLIKAVYDQLSGRLPAYGLRYTWNQGIEDTEDTLDDDSFGVGGTPSYMSVLSQYDLAVASSKPLGYNFLSGVGTSKKLPTIGHIQNLIDRIKELGTFTFNFEPFKVNGFTVNLGSIDFENVNDKITISFKDVKVVDTDGNDLKLQPDKITVDGETSGMTAMLGQIQSAINTTLSNANTELAKEIDKMTSNIEDQVNKMMNELTSQVNGKISSILNKLDKLEPYYGKINKAFDLYNKVANKVNNFLADPNAYLQVTAFYDMGGANYGIVSGKESDPTPFVGDGEAFKLFLSSYTGELIVPACKKYVAITKAPAGVDLASVNTGDYLNKVLDGNIVDIEVAKPAKAGVYEFTYQALDYNGYTSTKKFYIEVK